MSPDEHEELEWACRLFRVLGQPRRIEILRALTREQLRTKGLSEALGQPFKDLTYDLGHLWQVGAVTRQPARGGTWSISAAGEALLACYVFLSGVPREVTNGRDEATVHGPDAGDDP